MNLWIIHPDRTVQQALQTSLQTSWKTIAIQCFTPEELPVEIPARCIALTTEPLPGFPADRACVVTEPLKFKDLLNSLHLLCQKCCWPQRLAFQDAVLDTRTREWRSDGDSATLTEKEVGVLVYLSQRTEPASREDLLKDVWHYADGVDTHTIETHIYRLRQKIEHDPANPQFLVTTKDGYQLAARSSA